MEFLVVVLVPVILVMLLVWASQKKRLGTIRCRRCGHVGEAKGQFRPFRGMVPVCASCDSEDWLKVD
jgi:hypothetical protein